MRHRSSLVRIVVLVVFAGFLSERVAAQAQPPDLLRSYRFIPRISRVVETGGFAGVYRPYTVRGTFDLVTSYELDFPDLVQRASFENVDAWAHPHSPLTFVLSLDRIFNMSELEGTFRGPRLIHFSGDDGQGGSVRLEAALHGRLLHLTGATEPPCCDFFQYEIHALALLMPFGDFNFDGHVDAADYTVWRDSMGSTTDLAADGNGDGVVDTGDYDVWKAQVGTPAIDMSLFDDAASLGAAAVPEPSTFILIAGGVALLVMISQRLVGNDE